MLPPGSQSQQGQPAFCIQHGREMAYAEVAATAGAEQLPITAFQNQYHNPCTATQQQYTMGRPCMYPEHHRSAHGSHSALQSRPLASSSSHVEAAAWPISERCLSWYPSAGIASSASSSLSYNQQQLSSQSQHQQMQQHLQQSALPQMPGFRIHRNLQVCSVPFDGVMFTATNQA